MRRVSEILHSVRRKRFIAPWFDLGDDEVMHGSEGLTWSGIIPSNNSRAGRRSGIIEDRTITIQPTIGER